MNSLETTPRWGEDDYEEEANEANAAEKILVHSNSQIPPTHTSRIDSKGIKLITSYRTNPSHPSTLLKTVTKIRVHKVTVAEHVSVAKRRTWAKFGQAAIDAAEGNSNVTIPSRDDIYLEDPHADTDLQDEDATKALAGNLNEFWAKQQRRQLERKYDVLPSNAAEFRGDSTDAGVSADGWQMVGSSSSAAAAAKYVPPSARAAAASAAGSAAAAGSSSTSSGLAGLAHRMEKSSVLSTTMSGQDNSNLNTIRVTNISEETTEADLQQLFQAFGRISRVYLAKDKETLQSRGFAFVSYVHVEDAANAMEKLQGYGLDHLILKLEWARPSAPKNPSMEGTEYRSGYGKALAQDTKEKVTFASNLTTGTGR